MAKLELKNGRTGLQAPPTVIDAKVVPRVHHPPPPLERLELENRLMIRAWLGRYLVKATPYYNVACIGLVLLQGFHPFGFSIDTRLLGVIVGAVIVKHGVLLRVFGQGVWRKSDEKP